MNTEAQAIYEITQQIAGLFTADLQRLCQRMVSTLDGCLLKNRLPLTQPALQNDVLIGHHDSSARLLAMDTLANWLSTAGYLHLSTTNPTHSQEVHHD